MGHQVNEKHRPHRGSMQFWHRSRAKRIFPRITTWPSVQEPSFLGFAGYKAGMSHAMIIESNKYSQRKGDEIQTPVTIIECPPLIVAGIRFYKKDLYHLKSIAEIWTDKFEKNLERTIALPKKRKEVNIENILPKTVDIRAIVYTQPVQKKKPEIFEIAVGGKDIKEKYEFIKSKLGQKIPVSEVLKPGELFDVVSVTTGHGVEGSVKRFHVRIAPAKTEKVKRKVMSMGGKAPYKTRPSVPQFGQYGFFTRCECNKLVLKVSNPKDYEVNPKGGFVRYGLVNNDYVVLKGSVPGPEKRLIRFKRAMRPFKGFSKVVPEISYFSLESKM